MGQARDPVTTREAAAASEPVVEPTARGAQALAASYWREVEATTRGLVRVTHTDARVEVRLLRRGPTLIELGAPAVVADAARVMCTYPIIGGLLVGRPGGGLRLEQLGYDSVVLCSTLTEYSPRLPGGIYRHLQARLHTLISRRFFARLIREPA